MNTKFHYRLSECVSQRDYPSANRVIMNELGKVAVNHRGDFVDLLNHSDVPAHAAMADAQLIKLYFDNIHKKQLLVGTAFLVNMHNKSTGFDGEQEISDKGVKTTYRVLSSSLVGPMTNAQIEDARQAYRRSDWLQEPAEDTSGFIWDTIAKGGVNITNKVLDSQHQKKYGALEALQAQQKAKSDLAQSMIAQRQAQIDAANKQKELRAKNVKIGLIAGGAVLLVATLGILYYKSRK